MTSASRRLALSLENDRADRKIAVFRDVFPIYILVFASLGPVCKISTPLTEDARKYNHHERTEKRKGTERIVCEESQRRDSVTVIFKTQGSIFMYVLQGVFYYAY